jgi:antitoxin component YwqK of YwqJK toxin-antitoxin module
MKKLTILLFSILISFSSYGLFGLFDKTVCVETDTQERNGLVYLPNQQEPFTGKNLCKYENGQIELEGKVKDGKLDGKMTAWHENGQKKYERNYKDGKLDGKMTEWHENGQKKYERNYKDGECISGDCDLLL